MVFLKADKTFTECGLTIKEKLITASSGVRYYSGRKLATPDHKPAWITIHNTADINEAAGTNDAEQYSRATFNNNMGSTVVHYYIDETDCWHILADDTIGWHAADGKDGPGNTTSLAIEIIMDGSGKGYDVSAENRGALLAAILLHRYGLGIDKLTTHKRWYPKKQCPLYILPHWDAFVKKVQKNLQEIEAATSHGTNYGDKTLYYVQIGSYALKSNAARHVLEAKELGFDAVIKTAKVLGKTMYRVQIGAFSKKENAEAYAEKARHAGFEAVIV